MALGVELAPRQLEQLILFGELLVKWNKHFNLISRQDMNRLGPRHLLDSLGGAAWLRPSRILDLGSGAGLPGIPLAVARADLNFTLCDRSARRCRFLQQVVLALELPHVQVIQAELDAGMQLDSQYDTVVARGVATAREVWAMVHPHVAPGGCVLVYASTQDTMQSNELAKQDEIQISRHTYQVPGLKQTHTIECAERRQN